jgi:hypothetical protein
MNKLEISKLMHYLIAHLRKLIARDAVVSIHPSAARLRSIFANPVRRAAKLAEAVQEDREADSR